MAPSPSTDARLGPVEVEHLLDLAEASIVDGLRGRRPVPPSSSALPVRLREPVGAFVTLTVGGALNGCIGTVDGVEPLGVAVARLAWSAAFADPRLPALRAGDYRHLTIEVSILSALVRIPAASRAELLGQLRPGTDGLVIEAGRRKGLFLPSVWEQLPDPDEFLDRLSCKAGLPPRSWPDDLEASRFTAEKHSRRVGGTPTGSVRA